MSEQTAPGWRQLCLKNAEKRDPAKFCSLDVEREVEQVIASLSVDELRGFNLDEFREFLGDQGSPVVPAPRFEEKLRRELWWTMVQALAPGGRGVPQA
jgi:hypothetical protein